MNAVRKRARPLWLHQPYRLQQFCLVVLHATNDDERIDHREERVEKRENPMNFLVIRSLKDKSEQAVRWGQIYGDYGIQRLKRTGCRAQKYNHTFRKVSSYSL